MKTKSEKLNILLGFHRHLVFNPQGNDSNDEFTKNNLNLIIELIELLKIFTSIKSSFHFSGNLISFLDKYNSTFSSNIRSLLDQNQIELFSGGIYEPIFSFTPKEDRQAQLMLMNRLLNHIYGYTPFGAWIPELSWEPSLAMDLAKSRIQYTCLPKEYFISSGLKDNEISGYYMTEEEGRKLAIFPITYELNSLMMKHSPDEVLKIIYSEQNEPESIVLFYNSNDSSLEDLTWLKKFFQLCSNHSETIETKLFSEYFHSYKPRGRIYLPTLHDLSSKNTQNWRNNLLKYHEANLLHKKMLRVSKKINAAKEGKSRFKVIKEMINQAHDLLLKGQCNDAYWDHTIGGIYLPEQRHNTYSNLIKAENLIDSSSRHGSKWIQVYEIDYDCDGNDEIIIETETQNVYISPALSGAILEHDFRPKNINITNTISRKAENYHSSEINKNKSTANGKLTYDQYTKLSLIDHFLEKDISLEQCLENKLSHLTKDILMPYQVEKIKAKEETCKITMNSFINLVKLNNNPKLEFKKQISLRSGDSSIIFDYLLTNISQETLDFILAIEFNFNINPTQNTESSFYLESNKSIKTALNLPEEIKNINQISMYNKSQEIDIALSWNKVANLFKYPIETLSYSFKKLEYIYQGTTIFPYWHLILEPNAVWEISIKQDITSQREEL